MRNGQGLPNTEFSRLAQLRKWQVPALDHESASHNGGADQEGLKRG